MQGKRPKSLPGRQYILLPPSLPVSTSVGPSETRRLSSTRTLRESFSPVTDVLLSGELGVMLVHLREREAPVFPIPGSARCPPLPARTRSVCVQPLKIPGVPPICGVPVFLFLRVHGAPRHTLSAHVPKSLRVQGVSH